MQTTDLSKKLDRDLNTGYNINKGNSDLSFQMYTVGGRHFRRMQSCHSRRGQKHLQMYVYAYINLTILERVWNVNHQLLSKCRTIKYVWVPVFTLYNWKASLLYTAAGHRSKPTVFTPSHDLWWECKQMHKGKKGFIAVSLNKNKNIDLHTNIHTDIHTYIYIYSFAESLHIIFRYSGLIYKMCFNTCHELNSAPAAEQKRAVKIVYYCMIL